MGNEEGSMSVRSATLPTEAGQRITWSEIFVGQSICDFGTAVEEHDLIAFVIRYGLSAYILRYADEVEKLTGTRWSFVRHRRCFISTLWPATSRSAASADTYLAGG